MEADQLQLSVFPCGPVIDSETFAIVDAATAGGPVQETSILVFKVYQDGVQALDLGGSAAQSVVLMIVVVALTVAQFKFVERRVHY